MHDNGLVCLGSDFDDLLPERTIEPDAPDSRKAQAIRGCTDDPRVWKLVDRFGRACNDGTFRPGPVPIPDA